MNTIPLDEEATFHVARLIENRTARDAYLRQVCGDDAARRERLDALLRVCDQEPSFLEPPLPEDTVEMHGPVEREGTTIGPYTLLEPIGEGGMGSVYVADQSHPVRRRVALKVIKLGMDTKQVVARFEAERQALAMMDHPNISKVYDAGTTENGRPYFVMELVRGIPITDYCDREQISIPDRLELFVLVCRAVQHAHQKGIIHRDLKPSNVLVTVIDGVPTPKVIDFGVAKATGASLTDRTIYTGFAQMVGTPLYMSPEQADLSSADIDTRSDIYALGVLLYELLTGTTPFDSETLRNAAFDEMRRIIREDEPPRPSTRLGALGETISTVSTRRGSDPRQLNRAVRGELDWIAMKALEKDRRRRYDTANDFAADVIRYLTDRPVEACPPSASYRFAKFVRRNGIALTTTALVAISLVVGTSVSVWQASLARKASRAARTAEARASEQRDKALESKRKAETQFAITEAINTLFLKDILGQANVVNQNPGSGGLDPDIKVRDLLDRVAQRISTQLADQPIVEAAVRQTISDNYRALSLYGEALPHQKRAVDLYRQVLGPEDERFLSSQNSLALVHLGKHEVLKAERLLVDTLEAERRVLGEEHPATLRAQNDLALVYQERGKPAEAEPLLVATLNARRRLHDPDDMLTLTSQNNLADFYRDQERLTEAEPLLRDTLKAWKRLLPPDHPETLATQNNLALTCESLGQTAEAERLFLSTLESAKRVLGPDHVHTLTCLESLAAMYESTGRPAEAEPMCRDLVAHWRNRPDFEGTINTVDALERLGRILLMQEKYAEAEAPLRECVAICDAKGLRGSGRSTALGLLGASLLGQQKYTSAEPILLEAHEGMKRARPNVHVNMTSVKNAEDAVVDHLIQLYEAIDRKDVAATWREKLPNAGGVK